MGLEAIAKEMIIGFGKEIIGFGIRKLKEVLTDDEINEVVAEILPAESKSRKAQREIEANRPKDPFDPGEPG